MSEDDPIYSQARQRRDRGNRASRRPPARAVSLDERIDLLERTPLFSSLTRVGLRRVAAAFSERLHAKGETLFEEGEDAREFFVVARGELAVWSGPAEGRAVNRLGPGAHLGEIALLTGGPRTATVTAARPARVLVLDQDDFQRLIANNAALLAHIAKALSRQLDARTRQAPVRPTTIVVAVIGAARRCGTTLVAHSLAALLGEELEREVLLVRLADTQVGGYSLAQLVAERDSAAGRAAGISGTRVAELRAVMPEAGPRASAQECETLVDTLATRFPAIVIDAGRIGGPPAELAAELCDATVRVTASARTGRRRPRSSELLVQNLHGGRPSPPISQGEPYVLPEDDALAGLSPAEQGRYVAGHPRTPAGPPLARLARKLLGTSVGVALGGGAAFGIAHVGVLNALEQRGVPIDVVAGTSFGSIVAAGYAAGLSPEGMIEIARRAGRTRTALSALDPGLTGPGLLGGRRLKAVLRGLGLSGRFEDLARPCQVVAADIETGERVCIGEGPLDAACRASCSIPVLWSPERRDGRVLVDGGVVDPVPVDVVRDLGADFCIAVSVVPTLKKGVSPTLSRLSRAAGSLNPLSYVAGTRGMPSTVDIGMNSLHLMQYELGIYQSLAADAHVNVDASDFAWTAFNRALDLVERGAQAAERAMPQIERALAERRQVAP